MLRPPSPVTESSMPLKWLLIRLSNVCKLEQCIPSGGSESALGENVCYLLLGANKLELNCWIMIDALHDTVSIHAVGAWTVPQSRAAAFVAHLDHSIIVLKNDQFGTVLQRWEVAWNIVDVKQLLIKVRKVG